MLTYFNVLPFGKRHIDNFVKARSERSYLLFLTKDTIFFYITPFRVQKMILNTYYTLSVVIIYEQEKRRHISCFKTAYKVSVFGQ